jgi:glycosyltransferase involved in cell wall biosynthesis
MHEPPDLIVTNTLTVPAGALAAKWLCVPHIWYIHEFGREDHDLLFDLGNSTTAFLIDKLSNKVIVNSYAVLDKFRNYIPEHKLCVIYYGIEVPPQLKTDDIGSCNKVFRLIIVGQLCPGKRQEEAIKALSVLLRKGLNVRLTLLGYEHPEYGRTLRELVSELKVENQVEFIGQTPDPFKYVSDCHVALTCSGSEAFGRVTVEAMKLGKPVIGADNAGTAELIQDGVTGLLYRPGDAEDLARKVELLYHNPALAECISANARVWSNCTFTIENYVERLLSVFEEVIRAHQARRVKGRVAPDPID